jgi:hypothetical protein
MSTTWDDICATVKGWSRTVTQKAEQLTDEAATRLKISAKRAELEEQFTKLGKLTYEHTNAANESDAGEEIEQCMALITELNEELKTLSQSIHNS